ncbi:jg18971 [Pararge aegeria aegeria]|uniref:Jg18971 protein n=1 Tax=Pararge aegeria aegeria TaxID=348720 RepID=A0A8S4SR47_9NEOP|nr:jg18971 [Pararge aegeria aegeria]
MFGKVGIGKHNFRSLQLLSHTQVFQSPDALLTTPRAIVVIVDAFSLVTAFLRNITRFSMKYEKTFSTKVNKRQRSLLHGVALRYKMPILLRMCAERGVLRYRSGAFDKMQHRPRRHSITATVSKRMDFSFLRFSVLWLIMEVIR